MLIEKGITGQGGSPGKFVTNFYPTTSTEFVNTVAHYYRGEMSRMISWRDRIDRTTNWAIAAVAAMLSLSLSSAASHHGVLLFAMLIVYLLLAIESRRYRFFHVYRSRVRLIERNYYTRVFAGQEAIDPTQWMNQLAEDLRRPTFTITLWQAMSRRLRRNYGWIYLILLLAWLLKTTSAMLQPSTGVAVFAHTTSELMRNSAIGAVPGWVVLTAMLAFYGWLLYLILTHREAEGELAYGEVHV
jgi:uncharacterized membrane protein